MQSNNKKKICIVASSLGKGGAERASAFLSRMLDGLGYEVYIVTILPDVEYKYSGELLNLGDLKQSHSRLSRLIKFKLFLRQHKFDYIIDNRSRVQAYREFIITKLIYNSPTIYVIHNFKTSKVFTKYTWLNKYLYKNEIMIAVSKEAANKFKNKFNLKSIQTIYNAFAFDEIKKQSLAEKNKLIERDNYIIYYGRLDDYHKNLKLLLQSFKESKLPENNYSLMLLGDGKDLMSIKKYVNQIKLRERVVFKTFEKNPFPFVKHARFMVLSSRFEGFPMVIPEALSIGIPVVSVNCKSGPSEIIKHEYNGLLVENNNVEALANAMNRFIFEEGLYQKCKQNAEKSTVHLSMDIIAKEWSKLLN
ncbi:glycosyltransferase [Olleya sp. HaHaR_3_96]|uniref:glycosyltransferase n=1 Tax=Olleya sp. HaHaR_3_96 TaxID=2745560 RepID=UPI001C4ED2B6|nr:glycosyltransferase [Olleya sp. HaHaR_3_96]QXP59910.1 glycosyltransferase [Olleya sp. HaHaR_3_96]